MGSLAGHVGRGGRSDCRELAGTAGGAPGALEGLDVVGKDGPDGSQFGPVQPLAGQEAANVSLGSPELRRGLGNRE